MQKKRIISKVAASATAFAAGVMPLALMTSNVSAAGVATTISPSEATVNYDASVTLGFTPATVMNNGDTITIFYDAAYDDAALADLSISATKPSDTNFTSAAGVVNIANNSIVVTLTTGGALDTTNPFSIVISGGPGEFITPATAGSYTFSFTTSAGDFGAGLQYVGEDNEVTVTAQVAPTLSFNIRDLGDTADTNICDLGAVDTTTAPNTDAVDDGVGECGYSLAVGTNSGSGFQVQINADDALNTASYDMTDIGDNVAMVAGTETYGLVHVGAAQTGHDGAGTYDQTITEDGVFADNATDTSPIPTSATNFASYTDAIEYTAGTDATDVTTVMHGLAISSSTPTGAFDQVVTYTVTASF